MSVRAEVLNILERVFRQNGFASLLLRRANISKRRWALQVKSYMERYVIKHY